MEFQSEVHSWVVIFLLNSSEDFDAKTEIFWLPSPFPSQPMRLGDVVRCASGNSCVLRFGLHHLLSRVFSLLFCCPEVLLAHHCGFPVPLKLIVPSSLSNQLVEGPLDSEKIGHLGLSCRAHACPESWQLSSFKS